MVLPTIHSSHFSKYAACYVNERADDKKVYNFIKKFIQNLQEEVELHGKLVALYKIYLNKPNVFAEIRLLEDGVEIELEGTVFSGYFDSNLEPFLDELYAKTSDGILDDIQTGAHFEKIIISAQHALDDTYWSGWDVHQDQSNIYYENTIYPAVIEILGTLLDRPVSILDLGGGSGKFAHKCFQEFGFFIKDFYLLDRNPSVLERAKMRLSSYPVKILQKDMVQNSFDIELSSIDLVTAIGSLTYQVLDNKLSAIAVAKKVYDLMRRGGFFIIAGWTESILCKKDLNDLGFYVTNTWSIVNKNYLYICQK
jgi:SAM-dependent methyltransferase